jgi:hypothetical protein
MTTIITPSEIQEEDVLVNSGGNVGWIALGNAAAVVRKNGGTALRVEVQYTDGGIGYRYWDTSSEVGFTAITDPDPVTGKSVRTLRLIDQEKN